MNIRHGIRQSLFCTLLFFLGLPAAINSHSEELPSIDVHQFNVVPTEVSRTGRIYRFKMDVKELPKPGKIILVQNHGKPIMAFRVLQTEEGTGEWVGKRVRRYDTEGTLKLNTDYESIEKISDLIAPPPPEMKYDVNAKPELGQPSPNTVITRTTRPKPVLDPNAPPELDPLPGVTNSAAPEGTPAEVKAAPAPLDSPAPSGSPAPQKDINSYDDDLDGGASDMPAPKAEKIQAPAKPEEDEYEDDNEDDSTKSSALEVEENSVLSPYRRAISVTLDAYRNMSGFVIPGNISNGFGVSYSRTFDRGIFTRTKTLQDSFAYELGFGYYDRVNFSNNNDEYTVIPLRAELQYHLHMNKSFTLFGYGGAEYNWIMSSSIPDDASLSQTVKDQQNKALANGLSALGGIQQTFGVGLYYLIGPQWYLRVDMGWDRMGIGLAVKW